MFDNSTAIRHPDSSGTYKLITVLLQARITSRLHRNGGPINRFMNKILSVIDCCSTKLIFRYISICTPAFLQCSVLLYLLACVVDIRQQLNRHNEVRQNKYTFLLFRIIFFLCDYYIDLNGSHQATLIIDLPL